MPEWVPALIAGFWSFLKPPRGTDTDEMYAWRVAITFCVVGGRVVALVLLAWMLGLFAVVGGPPGLAYARDVQSQQTTIADLRGDSLGAKIEKTQTQRCNAQDSAARGDQSAALLAIELRSDLQKPGGLLDQYRALTGAEYRLFTCDEVKIITANK